MVPLLNCFLAMLSLWTDVTIKAFAWRALILVSAAFAGRAWLQARDASRKASSKQIEASWLYGMLGPIVALGFSSQDRLDCGAAIFAAIFTIFVLHEEVIRGRTRV